MSYKSMIQLLDGLGNTAYTLRHTLFDPNDVYLHLPLDPRDPSIVAIALHVLDTSATPPTVVLIDGYNLQHPPKRIQDHHARLAPVRQANALFA
jgi:hypothetical protein